MRIFLLISMLMLSSCVEAVVAATVGSTAAVVAQERSAGQAVDDTAIFWHIKHLYIQKNAQDLLAGVNVKVVEGRVQLTGNVNTPEARIDAVRLAWQPKGVKEVINEVKINDEKKLKEIFQSRWIATQIRSKILLEEDVRSLNYSIEVVEGDVYLMGIAQSTEELDKVTNLASTVKGVKRVVSHVMLKDDPARAV